MTTMVHYKKEMLDRAKSEKKFLVTVSVNGRHIKDDSCTVQAVVGVDEAKRLTEIAIGLLGKAAEKRCHTIRNSAWVRQ
jgi:hypothetical protein